jgi:hypothetical protein
VLGELFGQRASAARASASISSAEGARPIVRVMQRS